MRLLRYAGPVALCLLSVSCGRGSRRGTAIDREKFIAANVAMRSVADTAAKGDSLRRAALKRTGVTEKDLRQFVQVNGQRPRYMADIWAAIADTLDRRYDRSAPKTPPPPAVQAPTGPPGSQPPPALVPGSTAPATQPGVKTPPVVMPPVVTPPPTVAPSSSTPPGPRPTPRPGMRPPTGPPPDAQRPLARARPDSLVLPDTARPPKP